MKQLNLLVVDDDLDVCEFLQAFLEGEGYNVRTLSDPTRAVEELRDAEYHVVILDLIMPKLSGIELLDQIRNIDSDIAVIVLTGKPSVDSATESIALEVSAYITKPVSTTELRDTLERVIRKKGMVRSREEEMLLAIGRNIRRLRHSKKYTLAQMARRTHLSVSLLSQIERAESSASMATLYKVAGALGVTLSNLFGDY
jgi:DNA-binding NtrC family response regulator